MESVAQVEICRSRIDCQLYDKDDSDNANNSQQTWTHAGDRTWIDGHCIHGQDGIVTGEAKED